MATTARRFGDFEVYIDDVLGQGGMGKVFRGRQISLDRPVAVKLLLPEFTSNQEIRARFEREAKILARLDPGCGIVPIYSIWESGGQLYIAMEYVDGGSLAGLLASGKRPPIRVVLELMRGVCRALRVAHDTGIVHRDIKPSNVLISRAGAVKLADFGLAKIVGIGTVAGTTHGFMGTPAYASPEQIRGEFIDRTTDIYSAGCMFYELVTGRPPFNYDDMNDVLRAHLEQEPEDPKIANPQLSKCTALVIHQCLDKFPFLRQKSAEQLEQDIRESMDEENLDNGYSWQRKGSETVLMEWVWRCRPRGIAHKGEFALGRDWMVSDISVNALLAAADHDQVHLVDTATGAIVKDVRSTLGAVSCLRLNSSADVLAISASEGMQIYQVKSEKSQILRGRDFAQANWLEFSPRGNILAVREFGCVHLVDPSNGVRQGQLHERIHGDWGKQPGVGHGFHSPLQSLAFDPSGRTIASVGNDESILLWDISSQKILRELKGHRSGITCVTFNPNGSLLATAGLDSTIRLWNTTTFEPVRVLPAHCDLISHIAFNHSGSLMASVSHRAFLRLWDVDTGRELGSAPLHGLTICSISFASIDRTILCVAFQWGDDLSWSEVGMRVITLEYEV